MLRKLSASIVALTTVLAFAATDAYAHGVWVAKRHNTPYIVFGEGAKDNAYSPAKVTKVRGYGVDYSPINVVVIPMEDHARLDIPDGVSLIAINFDNGYWSKTIDGKWANKPMNEVPGSTEGNIALKCGVTYLDDKVVPKALDGLDIQIVPSVNPAGLQMGDKVELLVLKDGAPLVNAPVIVDVLNDPETTVQTGNDGKVTVTIRNDGLNVMGVEMEFPKERDDKATGYSYFSSLAFVSTSK